MIDPVETFVWIPLPQDESLKRSLKPCVPWSLTLKIPVTDVVVSLSSFTDLETAAQKQRELLHALSQQRFVNANQAKGSLESGGGQTAGPSARAEPLDGPWSLAEDWAPCALGTVPSWLHPLGKVAGLVWSPGGDTGGQMNGTRNGVPGPEGNGAPGPERNGLLGPERNGVPDSEGNGIPEPERKRRIPGAAEFGRAEGMMLASDGGYVEPIAEPNGFYAPGEDRTDVQNEDELSDRRRGLAGGSGAGLGAVPRGSGKASAIDGDGRHVPEQEFYRGVMQNEHAGPVQGGVVVCEVPDEKVDGREEAESDSGRVNAAGLCLQGSVWRLRPEEQARIREGISIL